LNKGQLAAINMKDDLTAYEYMPDNIGALMPAPQYMKKGLPPQKD